MLSRIQLAQLVCFLFRLSQHLLVSAQNHYADRWFHRLLTVAQSLTLSRIKTTLVLVCKLEESSAHLTILSCSPSPHYS